MKNKSTLNTIFGILMVVSLIGGLILVNQNQNMQRGAYFAGTNMLISPATIEGNVGQDMTAQLFVETQSAAKLTAVDTVVCYEKGLALNATNPDKQVVLNTSALKELIDVSLEKVNGKDCVRIIALAGASMKAIDYKSGMVRVANIQFTTTEVVAGGKITILAGRTKVGGYNPKAGATDTALKLGTAKGATYNISVGQALNCGWCGTECVNKTPGMVCTLISPPIGKVCENVDGVCTIKNAPITCVDDGDCVAGTQFCNSIKKCETCTAETCPNAGPVLNYKVSFGGVKASSSQCVVDWPLQFTVLGNGETKIYTDIVPELVAISPGSEKLAFAGSLKLTGFYNKDNIAVFITGPKHLQTKYGINNQAEPYNKAGGEISLTADPILSPLQDFSDYPLIPGDVVGSDSETQDGWINGVDFSYIKTKSLVHETVSNGGYLKGDLDGNCQVNSNDVNLLKISLQERQGQLY